MHLWSFWAKYCHFLHILSDARPKYNVNKVPRWVFRYVGNKAYDFSSKKKYFLPKNDQIWPKIGIFGQFGPGHAGLFNALLVGRLVVVARGLYLARHLFTLWYKTKQWLKVNYFMRHTFKHWRPKMLTTCLFFPCSQIISTVGLHKRYIRTGRDGYNTLQIKISFHQRHFSFVTAPSNINSPYSMYIYEISFSTQTFLFLWSRHQTSAQKNPGIGEETRQPSVLRQVKNQNYKNNRQNTIIIIK